MSRDRVRWLGTPLLAMLATVSVTISLYHLLTHHAPLLPTILGQWALVAMSVAFCGSVYYALTRTESGAERVIIGRRAATGYTLAAVASGGYAVHQYLTPEVVKGLEAIVFQALFMAVAGGIAGVFLGIENVKRDRTVSDLTAATHQLERTVEELDRSNEQLAEFAYVASHDLQEPARMVASYVDLLSSDRMDEESTADYLDYAEAGAREMLEMIDALHDYYATASRELAYDRVDTAAVVGDLIDALDHRIQDADVTVRTDELPTVEGDETQLSEVFEQLIRNALEHGTDVSEIRLSASQTNEEYRFAVADDGSGEFAGDTDQLFRIFADGGVTTGGPGVGLAVCELVVNRHRGEIWVESEAGEGTTVYFTLPVDETRPEPALAVGAGGD